MMFRLILGAEIFDGTGTAVCHMCVYNVCIIEYVFHGTKNLSDCEPRKDISISVILVDGDNFGNFQ